MHLFNLRSHCVFANDVTDPGLLYCSLCESFCTLYSTECAEMFVALLIFLSASQKSCLKKHSQADPRKPPVDFDQNRRRHDVTQLLSVTQHLSCLCAPLTSNTNCVGGA